MLIDQLKSLCSLTMCYYQTWSHSVYIRSRFTTSSQLFIYCIFQSVVDVAGSRYAIKWNQTKAQNIDPYLLEFVSVIGFSLKSLSVCDVNCQTKLNCPVQNIICFFKSPPMMWPRWQAAILHQGGIPELDQIWAFQDKQCIGSFLVLAVLLRKVVSSTLSEDNWYCFAAQSLLS